jgi:hypothetical protein
MKVGFSSLSELFQGVLYFLKPDSPKKIKRKSQVGVAHTCNSSYSGSRDGEDHGSRPAQTKVQETNGGVHLSS